MDKAVPFKEKTVRSYLTRPIGNKMLNENIEKAKTLRAEGKSIKTIAKILDVSPSSVLNWTKSIILTEAQRLQLLSNPKSEEAVKNRVAATVLTYKKRREEYQNEGRKAAQENNIEHAMFCMLYWGEGAKSRNELKLVNTDPDMLIFFVTFLKKYFKIPQEKISYRINAYLDNGKTSQDIENYWSNVLGLPLASCRKTIEITPRSDGTKRKKNIHVNGMCAISVFDTKLVQHVFGAIQEYAKIQRPEWIS